MREKREPEQREMGACGKMEGEKSFFSFRSSSSSKRMPVIIGVGTNVRQNVKPLLPNMGDIVRRITIKDDVWWLYMQHTRRCNMTQLTGCHGARFPQQAATGKSRWLLWVLQINGHFYRFRQNLSIMSIARHSLRNPVSF